MTAQVQQYRAAVYLRVSREDQDKEESNSIINQRLLIGEHLKNKPEIVVCQEQADDGYSGTGFDRPGFNKMMESVRAGEINCIVVKDLSRFGRNYIETGRYIQQIFPFLGLRFIAVNDGFDSLYSNHSTDNILIPFKNLINDAYSRDISTKIKSQLDLKRKKGEFIGAFAPYGYQKHPQDNNKLVIDPYAAAVVSQIFRLKLGGYSNANIAKRLNACQIYSPAAYKKAEGEAFVSGFQCYSSSSWAAASVGRILSNPLYIGNMQQGKSYSPSFRGGKRLRLPPQDWIEVEDTHQPIINQREFWQVQRLLSQDTRTSPRQEQLYALSGLLFCADCGQPMVRKVVPAKGSSYSYYVCSLHKASKHRCSSHSISAESLEAALEQIIGTHIKLVGGLSLLQDQPREDEAITAAHSSFAAREVSRYRELLAGVYEDYKQGLLSGEDYLLLRDTYRQKLDALTQNGLHRQMGVQGQSMDMPARENLTGNDGGATTVFDPLSARGAGEGGSGACRGGGAPPEADAFRLTRLWAMGLIREIRVGQGGCVAAEMAYQSPSHLQ